MRNLEGLKWKELTEKEKQNLYKVAYVDKDNVDIKTGECIVDFGEGLSILGKVVYGYEEDELLIDDSAVLYNPLG